jgi:hypothetical protein
MVHAQMKSRIVVYGTPVVRHEVLKVVRGCRLHIAQQLGYGWELGVDVALHQKSAGFGIDVSVVADFERAVGLPGSVIGRGCLQEVNIVPLEHGH